MNVVEIVSYEKGESIIPLKSEDLKTFWGKKEVIEKVALRLQFKSLPVLPVGVWFCITKFYVLFLINHNLFDTIDSS